MSQKCVIHKHLIRDGIVELELPEGTEILSAGEQAGDVMMWVLKTLGNKLQKRYFKILCTGEVFDRSQYSWMMKLVDTIQMSNGLVFHLFELTAYTKEPVQ